MLSERLRLSDSKYHIFSKLEDGCYSTYALEEINTSVIFTWAVSPPPQPLGKGGLGEVLDEQEAIKESTSTFFIVIKEFTSFIVTKKSTFTYKKSHVHFFIVKKKVHVLA